MKKILLKIKERLTGEKPATVEYTTGFPAIYATKEELELAVQAARDELASKRASYASVVAIGSDDTRLKIERIDKFKKHKLDCDNCGGPLTVGKNNIASCNFCSSQYYLEGFKRDYQEDWSDDSWRDVPSEPYWVDGGASIRQVLGTGHAPWS